MKFDIVNAIWGVFCFIVGIFFKIIMDYRSMKKYERNIKSIKELGYDPQENPVTA